MLGTLAEFAVGTVLTDWRLLYAANGAAFVPVLLAAVCIPASPRWLQQRSTRARRDQRQKEQLQRPHTVRKAEPDWAPTTGPPVKSGRLATEAKEAAVRGALARLYADGPGRAARVERELDELTAAAAEAEAAEEAAHAEAGTGGRRRWAAMWRLRQPVAMCSALAVTMQVTNGLQQWPYQWPY